MNIIIIERNCKCICRLQTVGQNVVGTWDTRMAETIQWISKVEPSIKWRVSLYLPWRQCVSANDDLNVTSIGIGVDNVDTVFLCNEKFWNYLSFGVMNGNRILPNIFVCPDMHFKRWWMDKRLSTFFALIQSIAGLRNNKMQDSKFKSQSGKLFVH